MHSIVTTPGFIIDSSSHGEADKVYYIFTRDLGLVRVVAQGIRLEKSKLRYHMKDYSFGVFSMVRGKEIWRLISAQESPYKESPCQESPYKENSRAEISRKPSVNELFARLSMLLRRVLHGEEANVDLFNHLESCSNFLNKQGSTEPALDAPIESVADAPPLYESSLESLVVLRILHSLGYVGNDKEIQEYIVNSEITPELLAKVTPCRAILNKHINKAIQESHL